MICHNRTTFKDNPQKIKGLKMKNIKAFILGIKEFKLTYTTHIENYHESVYYEKGIDLAHKITFRYFDN